MQMRVVWGKILPGQWDAFEAAYKKAMTARGRVKGLRGQWLVRDQNDHNSGYSITLWDSDADMRAYWDSDSRREITKETQHFFVNQFTITNCDVRDSLEG